MHIKDPYELFLTISFCRLWIIADLSASYLSVSWLNVWIKYLTLALYRDH